MANIVGTDSDDSLIGTDEDDQIFGGFGKDFLFAGAGNDNLDGGEGNDHLVGGVGDDYLSDWQGSDRLYGDDGNDTLVAYGAMYGQAASDLLDGGAGNDRIVSYIGGLFHTLTGGSGADTFAFSVMNTASEPNTFLGTPWVTDFNAAEGDRIGLSGLLPFDMTLPIVFRGQAPSGFTAAPGEAAPGADLGANALQVWSFSMAGTSHLYADVNRNFVVDAADLRVSFEGVSAINASDLLNTTPSIVGTDADDLLWGSAAAESLFGMGGNDTVYGQGGDDLVFGGDGDDAVAGGDGDDLLFGEAGNDTVGGEWWGSDRMFGGDGDDLLFAASIDGSGADELDGGAGNDQLFAAVGDPAHRLTGGSGADRFVVGHHATAFAPLYAPLTITDFDAVQGDRIDLSRIEPGSAAVFFGAAPFFLNFSAQEGQSAPGGGAFPSHLALWTVAQSDRSIVYADLNRNAVVDGGDLRLELLGNAPIDAASFTSARTALVGDEFDNVIYGTFEDDAIDGRGGSDNLFGGAGDDWIDTGSVHDYGPGLRNIADGGSGDDTLVSGISGDLLYGGSGSDSIMGGGGDDWLYALGGPTWETFTDAGTFNLLDGGDGNDLVYGADGQDLLRGGDGDDQLSGGGGDDIAYGGMGNDWFSADAGQDALFGEDGDDTFFAAAGSGDVATLSGGFGRDTYILDDGAQTMLLVVTDFDIGDVIDVWQPGTYTTTFGNPFDPAVGVLWLQQQGANTLLQWDPLGPSDNGPPGDGMRTLMRLDNVEATTLTTANFRGYQIDALRIVPEPGNNIAPGLVFPLFDFYADEDVALDLAMPLGAFVDGNIGDLLLWSVSRADGSALPSWLTFDPLRHALTGTPGNADVGSVALRVTVTDGAGASASDEVMLIVANTNDAPTLQNAPAALALTEDSAFNWSVPAGTFGDIDAGDTLVYGLAGADGFLPAWLQFNAATGALSGTPGNGEVGTWSLRLTAADAAGASVSTTLTLTVANVNDAPLLLQPLADRSAIEDSAFSFTVPAGAFADIDAGDALTYSAARSDGGALPSWLAFNAATRAFSGTPGNADVGSIDIRITATDAAGASAGDDFVLTVANVNDAPTVAAALPALTLNEDAAFAYTVPAATFADIDAGDSLAYSVARAGGGALPTWLVFNAATLSFSGTPGNGDVGMLNLVVSATDGAGAIASTALVLDVRNVNDAPLAVNDSATTRFSTAVTINVLTNDSDIDVGDAPVVASVTQAAHGSVAFFANGSVTYSPLALWNGSDSFSYTISDAKGGSATAIVNVTVTGSIVGTDANNTLNGGNAADSIEAKGGDDTVDGGGGNDFVAGGAGNDRLTGGNGNDALVGGAGNDTLAGSAGADVLAGGAGNDLLYGGTTNGKGDNSADTFVFNAALDGVNNRDTIYGFEATAKDKIALDPAHFAALLGGTSSGVDSGEFRAAAGGNAADGNDFLLYDSATGNLYYDADGNGAAARVLIGGFVGLTGTLDASDFTTVVPPLA